MDETQTLNWLVARSLVTQHEHQVEAWTTDARMVVAATILPKEAEGLVKGLLENFGPELQAAVGEAFFGRPTKQEVLGKIARGFRAVVEGLRQSDFAAEFGTRVLDGMQDFAADFVGSLYHATTGLQSTHEECNAAWVASGKPAGQFDDDIPF